MGGGLVLFPMPVPSTGKPDAGLRTDSEGQPLQGHPQGGAGELAHITSSHVLPSCCGFFFYAFRGKRSFSVGSRRFLIIGSSSVSCDSGAFTRGGKHQVLLLHRLERLLGTLTLFIYTSTGRELYLAVLMSICEAHQ